MSVDELAITPETNQWVEFKQGMINVLGKNESEFHKKSSRLYYGPTKVEELAFANFIYFIPFEKLDKIKNVPICIPHKIDDETTLRKTLFGGLKIKRIEREPNSYREIRSKFSPREYGIIKSYVKAWAKSQ